MQEGTLALPPPGRETLSQTLPEFALLGKRNTAPSKDSRVWKGSRVFGAPGRGYSYSCALLCFFGYTKLLFGVISRYTLPLLPYGGQV